MVPYARFEDRAEAGRRLGARLLELSLVDPVVFALPRGGVAVGAEVAAALGAPLDIVLVRKLGAPLEPELAIGAVVDGVPPLVVLNPDIVAATAASEGYIARTRDMALVEIARRRAAYGLVQAPVDPSDRTVIVVDDGLATGATARAALRALRRRGCKVLILAVPVAPAEAVSDMATEADRVVALIEAPIFQGVGAFYRDFHQLDDAEVTALMAAAAARR